MEHKEEKNLWNSEARKQEKIERLEASKTENGEKKPLKVASNKGKWIFSVIAIILVFVFSVWGLISLGIFQKYIAYGYVNGERISIPEYNYSYNYSYSRLNQLVAQGIAPANKEGRLDLDQLSPYKVREKEATWGEYLRFVAEQEIIRVKEYSRLARENKIELTEEEVDRVNKQIDNAITQLGGELALENALVPIMGPAARVDIYRNILKESVLANKYIDQVVDKLEFSDDIIEKTYNEKKEEIDTVSYREYLLVDPEAKKSEKTLAEKAKENSSEADKQKENKEEDKNFKKMSFEDRVKRFVAGISDEATFKQQVVNFSPEDQKESAKKDEATLRKGLTKRAMPQDLADWLFSVDRKKNEVKVFDVSETSKRVVLFIERKKPTENLLDYGFILLNATDKEVTSENKAAVEKALADYEVKLASLKDIKDKESFEAAVKSLKDEGLNVVDNWITDAGSSRIPQEFANHIKNNPEVGNVLVTKSDKSVIAYVYGGKKDKIAWKEQVISLLKNEKLDSILAELDDETKYVIKPTFLGQYFTSLIDSSKLKAEDIKKSNKVEEESKKTDDTSSENKENNAEK